MKPIATILLAGYFGLSCSKSPNPSDTAPRPPILSGTLVVTMDPSSLPIDGAKLGDTRSVNFTFNVTGTDATQAVLEISPPDNTNYARLTAALSGAPEENQSVFLSLPIAGTWVQQANQTGEWRVSAFVERTANAVAQSTFRFVP